MSFSLQTSKRRDFQISLAETSLQRMLASKKIDHLDFVKIAKTEFDISAVEYASQFFAGRAGDENYLKQMNARAAEHSVRQLLIDVNTDGSINDENAKKSDKAVREHFAWIEAAQALGCGAVSVRLGHDAFDDAAITRGAESLARLCEHGEKCRINILVHSTVGLTSTPVWFLRMLETLNKKNFGVLANLGQFHSANAFESIKALSPHIKAARANFIVFDEQGNEKNVDYHKTMQVVCSGGYRGYVAIDYQGQMLTEFNGIRAGKDLLERVRPAVD